MRTTTKEFKAKVQMHIIENLSTDETTDFHTQLQDVVDNFHSWYGAYEQKRTPNHYDAFKEWLLCLPSSIFAEYREYAIHEIMGEWFGEDFKPQKPEKEINLYYHLFIREFEILCKKEGVKVW